MNNETIMVLHLQSQLSSGKPVNNRNSTQIYIVLLKYIHTYVVCMYMYVYAMHC